jgi:hypothetical protein
MRASNKWQQVNYFKRREFTLPGRWQCCRLLRGPNGTILRERVVTIPQRVIAHLCRLRSAAGLSRDWRWPFDVPATAENFDEAGYLAANPDVAAAVRDGHVKSGRLHFDMWGKGEGRRQRLGYRAWPSIATAGIATLCVLSFSGPAAIGGWTACAIVALLTRRAIVLSEQAKPHTSCAGYFAAGIFCAMLLISSRPAFAAFTTFGVIWGLVHLSNLKFRYLRMHLHAYDFLYYIRSFAGPLFLFRTLPRPAAIGLAAVAAYAAMLALIWAMEPATANRLFGAAGLLVAAGALTAASKRLPSRAPWAQWYDEPSRPVSNFVETISEAIGAHRRGGVLATHPAGSEVPELPQVSCDSINGIRPTIIVVQNESTFPPWLYGSIAYDPSITGFFRSCDGRLHELRVETFGGVSWMSEFSLLTGIPASCYGSFRSHVFRWATNRIRHTLPRCLKQYGYRIAAVYPQTRQFIGMGKFYDSVGFDEVLDRCALGTDSETEPDSFYFHHALCWLERHFAANTGPAFVFISTISNHHPHECHRAAVGGATSAPPTGNTAEVDEYLRRLSISARDYRQFCAELECRFPGKNFLMVHYGDHQPPLAMRMFGNRENWVGTLEQSPSEEIAYRTYFVIDGLNFEPRVADELPDVVEVAYLGTVVLLAAGLPLDSVHTVRRQLMSRHKGRLFFADREGRIAGQLNHRLISAELISPH